MLYKESFVLYLNVSVCLILFLLALPTLLNKREKLKVRLAYFTIFFVVILTCIINLFVIHADNYKLVSWLFIIFFIPLLFGPAIWYYVKSLLGYPVKKSIVFSLIPGIISFGYGIYLLFVSDSKAQKVFAEVSAGTHLFYEITNLLTVVLTIIYCIKAWLFVGSLKTNESDRLHVQTQLKKAWAKEFVFYIFANVFVFIVLMLVLIKLFDVAPMNMDLIAMPIFMLFVYLLIAVRTMMMHTEFEVQYVVGITENAKRIQEQRLEISRDVHDNIGAQLTFIRSILDELTTSVDPLGKTVDHKIEDLSNCCNDSISELRNTLWVLNSEVIYLEDLKVKVLNFINKAASVKKDLIFNSAFDISDPIILSSKQAVNIFRIVQEILNNAMKYASASKIIIDVKQQGNGLFVFISDDGVGFNSDAQSEGYGLKNIKARVADINGSLEINTKIGEGSQFDLKFSL
ncbi:sensor histidine kinase [Pedobacter arcticus]|uniref:sensor histidine kinase n=1 Tax=Pedobacter arcticus TaxID=752140 RepID=UPI0002D64D06|nr:ATP-binding protein [Pedobacter arcticus]